MRAESSMESSTPSTASSDGPYECAICLAPALESLRHVSQLPCGHVFHRACLFKAAFSGFAACPVCRASLFVGGAELPSGDEGPEVWGNDRDVRVEFLDPGEDPCEGIVRRMDDALKSVYDECELNENFMHRRTLYIRKTEGGRVRIMCVPAGLVEGGRYIGLSLDESDEIVWDYAEAYRPLAAALPEVLSMRTLYAMRLEWRPRAGGAWEDQVFAGSLTFGSRRPYEPRGRREPGPRGDGVYRCMTCLEAFGAAECTRWLRCGHRLHERCYREEVLEGSLDCHLCGAREAFEVRAGLGAAIERQRVGEYRSAAVELSVYAAMAFREMCDRDSACIKELVQIFESSVQALDNVMHIPRFESDVYRRRLALYGTDGAVELSVAAVSQKRRDVAECLCFDGKHEDVSTAPIYIGGELLARASTASRFSLWFSWCHQDDYYSAPGWQVFEFHGAVPRPDVEMHGAA